MSDKPVRIIIDTNLWISFLIGLKSSPAVRNIRLKKFGCLTESNYLCNWLFENTKANMD